MARLDWAGLEWLDIAAFAFFVLAWLVYQLAVELTRYSELSLNAAMNRRRLAWFEQTLVRENRIVDTQVMNGLQNGTAFFASTSLIAIGGSAALLQTTEQMLQIFADLPFAPPTTRAVLEMKIIGLILIFAYAFFKFGWSYRLFNYSAILLGAIPVRAREAEGEDPAMRRAMEEAARMNVAAGRHFNRGQRAFFFAIAYLGWFLGPWPFALATGGVLLVMWNRQFGSDARAVLGNE